MSELDVLFYDRKNKREVKLSALRQTTVVSHPVTFDAEELERGQVTEVRCGIDKLYFKTDTIGTLCYRSDACPTECNWDFYLNDTDLVFLGVTYDPKARS